MRIDIIIGLLLAGVQVMPAEQGPAVGKKRQRVSFAATHEEVHVPRSRRSTAGAPAEQQVIPVKEIDFIVSNIDKPRSELIEKIKKAEFFQEKQGSGVVAIIFGKSSEGQKKPDEAAFKAIAKRIENARFIIVVPYGDTTDQSTAMLHEDDEEMFVELRK